MLQVSIVVAPMPEEPRQARLQAEPGRGPRSPRPGPHNRQHNNTDNNQQMMAGFSRFHYKCCDRQTAAESPRTLPSPGPPPRNKTPRKKKMNGDVIHQSSKPPPISNKTKSMEFEEFKELLEANSALLERFVNEAVSLSQLQSWLEKKDAERAEPIPVVKVLILSMK